MWNFSSEVQADVDFLKASNLQNIKVEGLDYDREKWMELMNCHAHLSTNLTESSERSPEVCFVILSYRCILNIFLKLFRRSQLIIIMY